MANAIFIGVDGGATKCKVRVENEAGHVLGQAIGGPANIRLSVDRSWESIYHALDEALKPTHIQLTDKNYRFYLGLGLAGCEMKEAVEDFLARPHPFQEIKLTSDAYTACLGAHGGRDGAIIIVGTGVVGYQVEGERPSQVGGWGFPQDDEGGGAWLGLQAARLTFQWIDHRAEKSPLVEDVYGFFNHDLDRLVAWASRANSSEFARLAPFVVRHSEQAEPSAVQLMKRAALAIDRIGSTLAKIQHSELRLPCSLFGGIAPFIEPWLSEELQSVLVHREADANVGAILMVRHFVKMKTI